MFKLIAEILGTANETMAFNYEIPEVTQFYLQAHREVAQIFTQEDTTLGIMKWGYTNTFPQSLLNLIEQSASAKPAIKRTSKFYKGAGFDGENEIVSSRGLTLKNVAAIMADDYATWEAFAVHCNYNLEGKVTSINPMRIADLRFNRFDELNYASKVGYHYNYGGNSEIRKQIQQSVTSADIKWFDRFNPNAVGAQISEVEGGISNYLGQVLYHSESGHSSYPISPLQAPVNYLLSDVENSILVRKETSTGFINSYLLKTSMDSEDATLIALENAIAQAQGARGTGKIITFSGLSPDELNSTLLEEIGGGGGSAKAIIESATLTYELNQKILTNAYQIPPALAGVDNSTGFSGEDITEAYFIFNAITQGGRDAIEASLNRILDNSIFQTRDVRIKKLSLDEEEILPEGEHVTGVPEGDQIPEANEAEMFKSMSGREVQKLMSTARKYSKGTITRGQAEQMLSGFGLSQEQMAVWLDSEEQIDNKQHSNNV